MRSQKVVLVMAVLAACLVPFGVWAQDADEVVQGDLQADHGQVNWSDRVIVATGSGAPDLKAKNVAVARLGAERVAKLDALRNIMETLNGLQLNSEITVENALVTNSKMKAKVDGIIRNFKVVKTKYYSDGGVDIIVQVSLDGVLGSTLVPGGSETAKTETSGEPEFTGVIIDTRGLKVMPALSPKVVDEDGKLVYGADKLEQKTVESTGVIMYLRELEAARKNSRVGSNPLVLKAMKLATDSKTDVVLSNVDALKLSNPPANQKLLTQAKVILVTD